MSPSGTPQLSDSSLDEQAPVSRRRLFYAHSDQALGLFEATEAEVEELKQQVEILEEEKRQASEDSRQRVERISELEGKLKISHKNFGDLENVKDFMLLQAIEDKRIEEARISELETKLRFSKKYYNILNHAKTAILRERIQGLEQQLSNLKGEKTAPSHKVGASSKVAAASADLQTQSFEDEKKEHQGVVEKLEKRLEEKDANAQVQAKQAQSTIDGLEKEIGFLRDQLNYERKRSVPKPYLEQARADLARYLEQARAELARLEATIQKKQAVIEQQEQEIELYAQAEAQASDDSIPENTTPPREEPDELGLPTTTADEQEQDDAESTTSYTNEPEAEQPEPEPDETTLQQQYKELEARNHDLQEQDTNWRKLFQKFMQRAAEVLHKDASKHQIKKGFKTLRKIVKEGEILDL